MDDALCAKLYPDHPDIAQWFFPGPHDGAPVMYEHARKICVACPVQLRCLNWELQFERAEHPLTGMFGGKTPAERNTILKRRKGTAA